MLGDAGDLYMDVANALLPIYQKVGRDWIFLANLKVPTLRWWRRTKAALQVAVDQSSFSRPRTPANNPSSTTMASPSKTVISGTTPPRATSGFTTTTSGPRSVIALRSSFRPIRRTSTAAAKTAPLSKYPIAEGDLWFDSDQLALYVAAEDEAGDLRWVITTPADRSVLQDEVDIPDLPFPFSLAKNWWRQSLRRDDGLQPRYQALVRLQRRQKPVD